MTDQVPAVVTVEVAPVKEGAFGGALEGASNTSRETALWRSPMGSPDKIINTVKPSADARGRDMGLNDGYAHGYIQTQKDSIVGSHYRLNCAPVVRVLKDATGLAFDASWAEEFQLAVEARFDLIAESDDHWLDCARRMTLTQMIRLGIASFGQTGEVAAVPEWLNRDRSRPLKTAIQLISPARVSNPIGKQDGRQPDGTRLSRGVHTDTRGRPLGYWVRRTHQHDITWGVEDQEHVYVPAEKPWGRKQFVHIIEAFEPGQTRGIADMVSALKHMRMTKTFSEVVLQNAIVSASYAAAIESELPPEAIAAMMGQYQGDGTGGYMDAIAAYMTALNAYLGGSENLAVDGVKIPHLFPGTKLNALKLGTPEGLGSDFETSMLRHTAAALGLSYEEFSRDFSKVSYSSLRGGMQMTARSMKAKKKNVADGMANAIYALVLEEEINAGNVPLPRMSALQAQQVFYLPLLKAAFCKANWIGAGAGQIDELKETQAAIMRIKAGLSTYEIECARLGNDFREIFEQRAREEGIIGKLGLGFSLEAQKAGARDAQNTMRDDENRGNQGNSEDDE